MGSIPTPGTRKNMPKNSKKPTIDPKNFFSDPNFLKSLAVYLLLGIFVVWLLNQVKIGPTNEPVVVNFSQVVSDLVKGEISKIVVEGDKLTLQYKNGQEFVAYKEAGQNLVSALKDSGVSDPTQKAQIIIKSQESGIFWLGLLGNALPIILTVIFFFILIKQAQKAQGSILDFGRTGAKIFTRNQSLITFANVAGVDEAKRELEEVVDFLKHPEKYRKLGARIPKGVLLVGPAGTGKTLLARAVAGEANVPFFSAAGSEFMEMLVGVGASRVRSLFQNAKKSAPSIIFIDEIESIGRHRALGSMGGHGEQEQTLNQILTEMDGFEPTTSVIVLAATNRPDLLDPALTRPGRFDRRVILDLPDINGRKEIFKIHISGKPLSSDVDIEKLAKRTVGFSGADIENMLNEAAILAARGGGQVITNHDLEEAATKVKLGPARQRVQSEEDKKITAYHEAGHAVVASSLPHMDPVHRVSIISRGLALGYTEMQPEMDRSHQTKTRLFEQITTFLGGRAAEQMIFSEMTVGAGSDLETASRIARKMVTDFGMSNLGPMSFADYGSESEWSYGYHSSRADFSEQMAAKIDQEVKAIIDECFAKAQNVLQEKRSKLDLIAEELVKKETIESDDFLKIFSS